MDVRQRVSGWGIAALTGALLVLVPAGPPLAPAHGEASGGTSAASSGTPSPTPSSPSPPRFRTAQGAARMSEHLPPRFRDQVVVDGLDQPTSVAFARDGRIFVAEKSGVIRVFDGPGDPTSSVFADLSVNVDNAYDRGLLSLALDPAFPRQPYVYVSYAYDHVLGDPAPAPRWGTPGQDYDGCPDPPGATAQGCVVSGRVSRLTADGDTMTGPERVLVEDFCLQFPSHATGSVAFGPDGMLYASAGEGASFTHLDHGQTGNPCGDPVDEGGSLRAQDLRTRGDPVGLDGTVIRIDPRTGLAPADNPLAGDGEENARRIVADGMRNPFRFAFRPGTTELYVGDVGSARYEEVNRVAEPARQVTDFGWPCYEGPDRHPGWDALDSPICEGLYAEGSAVAPFFGYARAAQVVPGEECPTGSSAVSGVAFPTSASYPATYRGTLAVADFARGCVWSLAKRADGSPDPAHPRVLVQGAPSPVDLVTGPGGDLYYVELGLDPLGYPDPTAGAVHRIHYYRGDQPPVVRVRADATSGPVPLLVHLDASRSRDPEGHALTYAWDLDGDGAYDDAIGARATTTFHDAVTTRVAVRVADRSDGTGRATVGTVRIFAGDTPPDLTIAAPAPTLTWRVGQRIHLDASATDADEGGVLAADRVSWDVTVRHCPSVCHSHPYQRWVGQATADVSAPDHEYPSFLLVTASATDARGLTVRRSVQLSPRTARVRVASLPDGLRLAVGDAEHPAPWATRAILRSQVTVTAPLRQASGGRRYVFRGWSDGGARSHVVTALPGTDPLVATYRRR